MKDNEAAEPEAQQFTPPQPLSPFQRIVDKFQMELGRLNGQLLVERTEREMEREQYIDQINSLTQQLQDAGVVPKSDGGQPGDASPGDKAPTPIRQAARPGVAKKAAPRKRR